MTAILTLADARTACRIAAADTTNDSDLTTTYIPAVAVVCEDQAGPILAVSGLTWTVDGGRTFVVLPSKPTAIASVTETGVALAAGVDYTVNLRAGIITRGSTQTPYVFLPGQQNVVVTYSAGYAATTADVTANHRLAARIILRQMWQADQQGTGAGRQINGAGVDLDTVSTPSGFLVPRRAYELLKATPGLPGFA